MERGAGAVVSAPGSAQVDRYTALLRSAQQVFAAKGYAAASIEDIARTALRRVGAAAVAARLLSLIDHSCHRLVANHQAMPAPL